jgi:phosphonate transport system ATP-binding protein
MFALDDATKRYGPLEALAPLTLTIASGERVALMGPSGSGKTTLLNLLSAALHPDTGTVRIGGQLTTSLRPGPELAHLVGVMPQGFDLVPSLAVVHNVLAGRLGAWSLGRSLASLVVPREVALAEAALERVGIAEKLYVRTSRLSGGEQQRVALARLLVQRPRVILADEPVSSVDPARAEDLLAMLVDIAGEEGRTLVASMHAVPLALRYFSRVVALRAGRVIFDRPTASVTTLDLDALYALEARTRVDAA